MVKISSPIILTLLLVLETSTAFTAFTAFTALFPTNKMAKAVQDTKRTMVSSSSSSSSSSEQSDIEKLNLTPQLSTMTKAFSSIPDEKTRHKQLLYMANQLQPMDPSLMVPQNKVPGCLSTVYVDCHLSTNDDGQTVLNYVGTSDGLLTKGLVALLIRGLSGCTPEEIQKVDPEFISVAGITQSLTPGRNNGFLNMLAVMKSKAAAAAQAAEVSGGSSRSSDDNDGDDGGSSSNDDNDTPEGEGGVITSFEPVDGKPMYNDMMQSLLKLKPTKLELVDNSDQHEGHAGSKGYNGESHFALEIVSEAFGGMSLVKRHQLIYLVLGDTMSKIHALQISAKSTDEV